MNKLSLSCLKSLVESRPKGDWDFLTQLVLIWPEARAHYWNRQGFRYLLPTWPLKGRFGYYSSIPFLCLPQGWTVHGFLVEKGLYRVYIRIYDHEERLLDLVYLRGLKEDIDQWNKHDLLVYVYKDPVGSVSLDMNPVVLAQVFTEFPMVLEKVLRALNLARDLGKTDIKTLNSLAALTQKSLNPDPQTCFPERKHE